MSVGISELADTTVICLCMEVEGLRIAAFTNEAGQALDMRRSPDHATGGIASITTLSHTVMVSQNINFVTVLEVAPD